MELVILVIGGVGSTAVLLVFCVYIYLVMKGNSLFLYNSEHEEFSTKSHKIFLGLAAIALMVCFYQGSLYLLWWMPELWGSEGQSVRTTISLIFVAFGGMAFIHYLAETLTWKMELDLANEKAAAYERTLKAIRHPHGLNSLKQDYENKIAKILEDRPNEPGQLSRPPKTPESIRIGIYLRLIAEIDKFEQQKTET